MRRFTELLGFDVLGGFASFADAGFLWGSSWRLGVDSLEGTAELLRFCALGGCAGSAGAGFLGIFYDAALGQRGRRLFSMLRLGGSSVGL